MKLSHLVFSGLLMLGGASFADHHECKCDHACQEACAKGGNKDCKCEACDCAKSGKCEPGKCEHKEHKHDKKTKK